VKNLATFVATLVIIMLLAPDDLTGRPEALGVAFGIVTAGRRRIFARAQTVNVIRALNDGKRISLGRSRCGCHFEERGSLSVLPA
jgi:hypothetical protein